MPQATSAAAAGGNTGSNQSSMSTGGVAGLVIGLFALLALVGYFWHKSEVEKNERKLAKEQIANEKAAPVVTANEEGKKGINGGDQFTENPLMMSGANPAFNQIRRPSSNSRPSFVAAPSSIAPRRFSATGPSLAPSSIAPRPISRPSLGMSSQMPSERQRALDDKL